MLNLNQRGLTALELLITVSILVMLMATAMPPLTAWLGNARVRSAAEQLQNSLRLAQSEALRRNRQTVLALTNATPALAATPAANGRNWYAQALPVLSGETANDSFYLHGTALTASMGIAITGPALLCFNSIGRPVSNSATGLGQTCSAPTGATAPTTYDLASSAASKPLRVQVFLGGQVRLCDPSRSVSTSAPDGC
jgi:type IV fimbrial biogenesis protein FimT